jgi:uncharacterized protein DUF4411
VTDRIYCMDTSALIDGLERYYPRALFPALWTKVAELVKAGRIILSEEVWEEGRKHDAAVKEWCDEHGKDALVVATDGAIASEVQDLLKRFPKMVADMKGRNRADPFVIAVAKHRNAVVVTGEGAEGNANRPKIPYVCGELRVECYRFIDIIRDEGWAF